MNQLVLCSRYLATLFVGFSLTCTLVGCGGGEEEAISKLKALGAPVVVKGSFVLMQDAEKIKEAMPLVRKLSELTSFDAAGTQISDEDLVHVGKLKGLTNLNLKNTNITDAGIKHLTGLRALSSLHLMDTKITSACLSDIGKLDKLGVLTLAQNDLSGGYDALASCDMLAWIVISDMDISDADVDDLLTIPDLSRVSLTAGRISDAGLGKLKAKGISVDIEQPPADTVDEPIEEEQSAG